MWFFDNTSNCYVFVGSFYSRLRSFHEIFQEIRISLSWPFSLSRAEYLMCTESFLHFDECVKCVWIFSRAENRSFSWGKNLKEIKSSIILKPKRCRTWRQSFLHSSVLLFTFPLFFYILTSSSSQPSLSTYVLSSTFFSNCPHSFILHFSHPYPLLPPPLSLFGTPRFSSSSLCLPPDGWQRVAACCGQANYLHNYDLPLNHMIPYLGVGN